MRLLHVIDSLKLGGAQSVLLVLAEECVRLGVDFEVLALSEPSGSHIEQRLATLDVPVHFAPPTTGFQLLDPRLRDVRRILGEGRHDVIHAHLDYATVATAIAAAGLGLTKVATLHNSVSWLWERDRARRAVLRWATARMDALIACGELVAKELPQAARHPRIEVVANPAPRVTAATAAERVAARRELVTDDASFAAITVSRLVALKRIDCAIDAVAERRRHRSDIELTIVGDGPERGELEARVRRLGLEGSVRFLGPRSDVDRLMHGADALLCPSEHEGMPMSVLEAMSAGLPVIATSAGDLGTVLGEGRGIVIDAPDARLVAASIETLMASPDRGKHLGLEAQKWVSEHRSVEGWLDRITSLYEAVLAVPQSSP